MQISARISPDDIQDFVVFVRDRDYPKPPASVAFFRSIWDTYFVSLGGFWLSYSIVSGMLGFVATLGWLLYQGFGDVLWQSPVLMALVVLGILLLPVGFAWLRGNHRLQKQIKAEGNDPVDVTSLKDGLNIGKARFEFDDDGVQTAQTLLEESYTWEAFQALEETETNFFLMIDRGSALVVPKRAFLGSRGRQSFKALVQSHMSAGER